MFVGHYGVSFALAGKRKKGRLAALFVAVQLLDFVWALFILAGIEKARVIPHLLPASSLDLYYLPWTHGLVTALLWAVVGGAGYALYLFMRGERFQLRIAALLFGVAVFSHWLLDLVAHRPDLPLWGNEHKVGLGLWHSVVATLIVEIGLLIAGAYYYLRSKQGPGLARKTWLLVAVLSVIEVFNVLGPVPAGISGVAVSAFVAYTVFAVWARWIDRSAVAC